MTVIGTMAFGYSPRDRSGDLFGLVLLTYFFLPTSSHPASQFIAGSWIQEYSNRAGHRDSTATTCSSMTYQAGRITLKGGDFMIAANSGLVGSSQHVTSQNLDENYKGWYRRPWDRAEAWEFFRILGDGTLDVRHFCIDGCTATSPEGSRNYC